MLDDEVCNLEAKGRTTGRTGVTLNPGLSEMSVMVAAGISFVCLQPGVTRRLDEQFRVGCRRKNGFSRGQIVFRLSIQTRGLAPWSSTDKRT